MFTPVLQRQLQGVPDCYAPAIFNAIVEGDGEEITILEATKFYLGVDPLNPMWIPSYRRNMLYIREARWHLAVLMEEAVIGNKATFRLFLEDHDFIMTALGKEVQEQGATSENGYRHLSQVEIEALVYEGIDKYFKEELSPLVSVPYVFYNR